MKTATNYIGPDSILQKKQEYLIPCVYHFYEKALQKSLHRYSGNTQAIFFCASGSEANDGAALLAQLHNGKHWYIAVQQGLSGCTKLTMNLTGLPM